VRIALLAEEDPGWGGIGTYVGVLGHALAGLGHDVQLVLRGWEDDGEETLDGLPVHRVVVPEPNWRRGTVTAVSRLHTARESLVFAARAARVLGRIGADVVEAPEFHAPGLRAARAVVRLHAPAFLTAKLAAQRADLDARATELLECVAAHRARRVTAPSRAIAEVVQRRWRVSPHVIPNPIDEQRFNPDADTPEDPATILVVGRVERAKGQDLLIEALPAIRTEVPDACVRLVGEDGGLAETLARRARALGLGDAVSFDGARPRDELPAIYRAATVCSAPSRFEAFGYGALEAMACGRPVVATRAGGLAEVVGEDGGVLVAPENLAQALIELLTDADERRRLGAAARARVLVHFSASADAARMA
jgi:glycosyltransferase involved in cell wall biosynthesis